MSHHADAPVFLLLIDVMGEGALRVLATYTVLAGPPHPLSLAPKLLTVIRVLPPPGW
jgi:hypothetical protein